MTVLTVDFQLRRLLDREYPTAPRRETTEDIVRREVMAGCLRAGVPKAAAMVAADGACRSVRAGFDPSSAVRRAVERATASAFPDGEPPSAA
jgi:hypothetical protein